MHRLIISIWLLLYLVPANGINIQLHYCLGSLKSVEIFPSEEKACGCSSKWRCCEYTYLSAKIGSEHQAERPLILEKSNDQAQEFNEQAYLTKETFVAEHLFQPEIEASPPLPLPLYLWCQSLIFYG